MVASYLFWYWFRISECIRMPFPRFGSFESKIHFQLCGNPPLHLKACPARNEIIDEIYKLGSYWFNTVIIIIISFGLEPFQPWMWILYFFIKIQILSRKPVSLLRLVHYCLTSHNKLLTAHLNACFNHQITSSVGS